MHRITVIIHDDAEAPRSFALAGRSHEELDDLQGEVTGWLGFLFHEAHGEIENAPTSESETAAILADSLTLAAIAEAEAEFDGPTGKRNFIEAMRLTLTRG